MPIDSDVQIELNNIYNQLQVINSNITQIYSQIEILDGRLTQLQTDFNTFVEDVESVSQRSEQSPTAEELELLNQELANTANTL